MSDHESDFSYRPRQERATGAVTGKRRARPRVRAIRTTWKGTGFCSSGLVKGGGRGLCSISQFPPLVRINPGARSVFVSPALFFQLPTCELRPVGAVEAAVLDSFGDVLGLEIGGFF